MKEKYGFVYIWRDSKRKMFYIGSHWGTEDDGYICSSNRMRNVYKRRPNDFKRRILARIYSTHKELLILEDIWLKKVKQKERYYNRRFTTSHWVINYKKVRMFGEDNPMYGLKGKLSPNFGRRNTEESKKRMSLSHKGQISWNKGKTLSNEYKEKLKTARKKFIENGGTVWNKGKKTGVTPWNKGLKNYMVPWNKGLTKQTDSRLKGGRPKKELIHGKQ